MHPNPNFRNETETRNVEFLCKRSFGILAINADSGPLISHVPFLLSDDCKSVELHLVRSNPILASLASPQPAVIAVSGADAYISPDWYNVADQVPTWNYIAVHVRGRASLLPQDHIHDVLNKLTHAMEEQLLPKKPWTSKKMDQGIYERMLRQIVPVRMDINSIDGTWKLSQNKPDEVRLAAAEQVAEFGIGSETKLVSDLMFDVGKSA